MGSKSAPYTIEQAVTDEQAFWKHIRSMLKSEAVSATAEAVLAMKTVAAAQVNVVDRVNGIADQMGVLAGTVNRIEGVALKKVLLDDQLRDRLTRFLNEFEARPTPPSAPPLPPSTPPMAGNGGVGHD